MFQLLIDMNNGWRARIGPPTENSDQAVNLMMLARRALSLSKGPEKEYCPRIDVIEDGNQGRTK